MNQNRIAPPTKNPSFNAPAPKNTTPYAVAMAKPTETHAKLNACKCRAMKWEHVNNHRHSGPGRNSIKNTIHGPLEWNFHQKKGGSNEPPDNQKS
jgi:hypothetical protein